MLSPQTGQLPLNTITCSWTIIATRSQVRRARFRGLTLFVRMPTSSPLASIIASVDRLSRNTDPSFFRQTQKPRRIAPGLFHEAARKNLRRDGARPLLQRQVIDGRRRYRA